MATEQLAMRLPVEVLSVIEGYTRIPPTSSEDDAALASLRSAIAEEPW